MKSKGPARTWLGPKLVKRGSQLVFEQLETECEVLPCEVSDDPDSCLHVIVPVPAVQQAVPWSTVADLLQYAPFASQATYTVPETGGEVIFEAWLKQL